MPSDDRRSGIDFLIRQDEKRVIFDGLGLGHVALRLKNRARLREIVTNYAIQVENARPVGLPVRKDIARDFLRFVKKAGNSCFEASTEETYDDVRKAYKILYAAMSRAVLRRFPLRVEIIDDGGEYLPWEWLGIPDNTDDYVSEARTTLGFAAVVYRRVRYEARREGDRGRPGGRTAADVLAARPQLPVRFFRNPELGRTRVELRFFRYSKDIELTGPLPEKSPDGQLALAEQLVDPAYKVAGFDDRHPDQVVHFSCHHQAKGDPSTESDTSESVLKFGGENGSGHEIGLSTLRNELIHAHNGDSITVERPLIFFNACRGTFYPFTAESAVEVLLRNGNRAMISTMLRVPDDAAAEFGQFFYERLLHGDCTAAEALLYAKWRLLNDRSCPLGILYGYYGRPDLHVLPVRRAHAQDPIIALWNGGIS